MNRKNYLKYGFVYLTIIVLVIPFTKADITYNKVYLNYGEGIIEYFFVEEGNVIKVQSS